MARPRATAVSGRVYEIPSETKDLIPLSDTVGILYVHGTKLCDLDNMECKAKFVPHSPTTLPSIKDIYDEFHPTRAPTGAPWRGNDWRVDKTHLDIDLTALPGVVKDNWIVVALSLKEPALTFMPEYYKRAITVSEQDDVKYFKWIKDDDLSYGNDGTRQATIIFATSRSGTSQDPYVSFNVGVVVTDDNGADWKMALLLDPHIKNEG